MGELLERRSDLGQDAALEAAHVEENVWVVLAVDGDKRPLPLDGGDGARETILYVPEDSPAQVDIMFHEPHASISRPTLLVIVADNVLVVWVWVLRQVSLDQVTSLLGCKPEEDMYPFNVTGVETYRM